jgi:hypothetical protein
VRNSSSKLLGRITYYLCRLLLPRLLKINADTAAKGKQRLLAEFDFLDSLLQQQAQQQQQQSDVADGPPRLPYYLCGTKLSMAGELMQREGEGGGSTSITGWAVVCWCGTCLRWVFRR